MAKSQNDMIEEIKKRVKDAKEAVDVTLNPDDPNLVNQISLGDDWDNPSKMAEALDMHPLWSARWAFLLKTLKKQAEKNNARYKTWESVIKEEISDEIFQENQSAGMTANNSKPTGATVDRRFEKLYVQSIKDNEELHNEYLEYKKPVLSIEDKIDAVQVVVEAFQVRTQMLIQLGGLLRSLIDNKVIVMKNLKK